MGDRFRQVPSGGIHYGRFEEFLLVAVRRSQGGLARRRPGQTHEPAGHLEFLLLSGQFPEFHFQCLAQSTAQGATQRGPDAWNGNERTQCPADEGQRRLGHALEHATQRLGDLTDDTPHLLDAPPRTFN